MSMSPPPPPAHSSVNGKETDMGMNRLARLRTKPLTPKQERRLVAYLDEQFLTLTREFKKRTSPTTHVPTLNTYIRESRKLLSFILQIPPVDPSAQLRVQFLLRLTGDVLSGIVGYGLMPPRRQETQNQGTNGEGRGQGQDEREGEGQAHEEVAGGEEVEEPRDYTTALRELLDWLDDLDQAWLAVLQSQVWDPEVGEGVDLILFPPSSSNSSSNGTPTNSYANPPMAITGKSTPISQTDVTRLRSLLVTNIADLEEWLSQTKPSPSSTTSTNGVGGGDDVAGMLERLGLLDEFDDLFSRTMDFLGGFGGGYVLEPETVVQDGLSDIEVGRIEGEEREDMEDEDMNDMVEVVMGGCS